jgi:hypothetical protein
MAKFGAVVVEFSQLLWPIYEEMWYHGVLWWKWLPKMADF